MVYVTEVTPFGTICYTGEDIDRISAIVVDVLVKEAHPPRRADGARRTADSIVNKERHQEVPGRHGSGHRNAVGCARGGGAVRGHGENFWVTRSRRFDDPHERDALLAEDDRHSHEQGK